MATIITINEPDAEHLETVIAEMRVLGAPKLRAIRDEAQGVIVALEGSHRIAAAKALGLTPVLLMLDDEDMITCEELGYDDCGWFDGEAARALDIRDRIAGSCGSYTSCPTYKFEDIKG